MKLFPKNIDQTVGFDEVKKILAGYTQSAKAQKRAITLKPKNNPEQVELFLNQTVEMQRLLKATSLPNLSFLDDIKTGLESMTVEGKIPETVFLFHIKNMLGDTQQFKFFLEDILSSLPTLNNIISQCEIPYTLLEVLEKILDEEGNISPLASPELKEISDRILQKEKEVRKLLNQRFEIARKNGWAGDTEITIRNERLVLPIISEHKKKVKGLVHDVSATGKFLYIEPLECFEENNNLRELYIAKRKEIERILRMAGKLLIENQKLLVTVITFWEEIDFAAAKARLANSLNANKPEISNKPSLKLYQAFHPLLFLKIKEATVKNDLILTPQNHLLLISGPNAGGKSVLLKTSILLQMMFQSGLCITASPNSELFVFDDIFTDISDNQSIEDDLSTYSAHLVNMKYILTHASEKSLVAIDELGTGTDPELGAPLAEVMLEKLWKLGAYGLVSSHLGSLKQLPEKMEGLQNASMQYDPHTLRPLFKLTVGRPGNSFAFELAANLNFPKEILDMAAERLKSGSKLDYEEMNLKLEKLNFELESTKTKLQTKEQRLDKLISEYGILKEEIKSAKNIVLKQARDKASRIIADAEILLKKLKKEGVPDKKSVEQFKKEIQVSHEKTKDFTIKEKITADAEEKPELLPRAELAVGDKVFIHTTQQSGEILELKKSKALVMMGELRTLVSIKDIQKLKKQSKDHKVKGQIRKQMMERQVNFRNLLDVRGDRGDVATMKIEKWLDEAYMLGEKNLKVIHGHGDGILKSLLKDLLKTHHGVASWTYEKMEMGGDGATIIVMT